MRAPNFKPVWTVSVHFESEQAAREFYLRLLKAQQVGNMPLYNSLLVSSLKPSTEIQFDKSEVIT